MNRDWVLFHLREAEAELRRTIAEIEATPDYGYGEFSAAIAHAYITSILLGIPRARARLESRHQWRPNFLQWRQFPTDIYLGP